MGRVCWKNARAKAQPFKVLARATATCLAISEFIWNECHEKGVMYSLLHIEMPFVSPIVAMETVRVLFDAAKNARRIVADG